MSQVLVDSCVKSRNVAVIWFGNCSYRELKVTYEVRKMICPLCLHDLEDGVYSGSRSFVKDRNTVGYVRDSWLPLAEDGIVVWSAHPEDGGRKPYWSRDNSGD